MPRKKLTEKTLSENQEGLLALYKALKVDADITLYAKLVLGYITKLYGREITKEDGYAHVSNAEMRKGCEIGSDTMTNAVVELVNAGLITVERGQKRSKGVKGVENRYFLSGEIMEKIHFKTNSSVYSTETNSSVYSTETTQKMGELLHKIDVLLLKVNELTEENRALNERVESIEKKLKSSMDMDMEVERSKYNTINYHTGIEKESILTDTKEKDEVSGREDAGDGYVQPPVKQYVFDPRYFSNGKPEVDTVSVAGSMIDDNSLNTSPQSERCADASMQESSSSFNEEESHPDSETSTVQQNDTVELTDRSISLHLNKGENPPQVAPHPPLEDFIAVLTEDVNRRIMDWAVSLTDPSYTVTESDAQYIVTDALGDYDDKDYYLPQFSLISFTDEVMDKMRNVLRQDKIHKIIVRNSISPVSKPYNEINEGTGILAENGTEPHSRFLRAFLPIGGIVGHPE